ncbi:MAG: SRPBCC domain-containing protein [Thermoplasmata archaeon]
MSASGSDAASTPRDTTVITVPTEIDVIAVRVFPVSRERAYAAFVTPELVAQWWGPAGWRTIVDAMEVRVGGRYQIRLLGPDGQMNRRSGTYREIVPGSLLVRTLEFGEIDGLTVVESIHFEPAPGGTRVTLRTEFPSPVDPNRLTPSGIQNGVRSLFRRLGTLLSETSAGGG